MTAKKSVPAPAIVDWAKARLDEMDATVASLQAEAAKLQAAARKNVQGVIAEMLVQRDAFSKAVAQLGDATEDAWAKAKATLETEWDSFEGNVQKYFGDAVNQGDQQIAVFRASAEAQRKAWQHAIAELKTVMAGLAAEQKSRAEAAMKRMNADAEAAKAKLDALSHAGSKSWSAYKAALTATRSAFDSANQAARDAFKRAA